MAARVSLQRCSQFGFRRTGKGVAHPYGLPSTTRLPPSRTITSDEKPLPKSDQPGKGPNQDQLPHVSEEAAATSNITGETQPELDQSTPVEEVGILT